MQTALWAMCVAHKSMELNMIKNKTFPMALIAAAIFSGCSSVPQSSALTEAHSSYDIARNDPVIMNLAAAELLQAGEALSKADHAFSKGESEADVAKLADITKLKVGIAQETAQRKTYELTVADANTKHDQERLEVRTAEADTAKQQVAIVQETVNQQAVALAVASVHAERNEVRIAAKTAEADSAKQEVAVLEDTANQQADALALAAEKAKRDQTLITKQQVQLKELNAKKTDRGLVMTLGDVLFSTNKAQLEAGGMRNMRQLADFLKQYPHHKVLVEGYTDNVGGNDLNQSLSDRRANAVRTALIDKGISSDRISTRGYGEAFPVAGNDTGANRQLNRRVEIILSDASGNVAQR